MSTQPGAGQGEVIDFAAACRKTTVVRLKDGRRKGDHGNRASAAMREATIKKLKDLRELRGHVTTEDKRLCAVDAGVDLRTVNRWWERETALVLDAQRRAGHDASGCLETCAAGRHGRGCRAGFDPTSLPGWLYRFNEPERLQLTTEEIAFFGSHTRIIDAIHAVRTDPNSRLRHYATSTLYAAYANVAVSVRVGARHGSKAQRKIEGTFPLTGRDQVNESWSIDEYDLKVRAVYGGVPVEPKVLIVRERLSGLPLSMVVLPRAATGADTGRVLAAAAIGYTVPHPFDATQRLRVSGVARYLNSDQGGAFLGADGSAAARRLGISLNPIPSHQPQANGDHEVMHQSLLAYMIDGPGSRRGWTDRAGNRLDHGEVPFEAIAEDAHNWFASLLDAVYAKGERAGMSRLEVYATEIEDGNVYNGHTLTAEDEASFAEVLGERSYDPTRGVEWEGRYWLSDDLANKAKPSQRLTIKRLLDPDTLYVFDRAGKFLAVVGPRDDADGVERHRLYTDRAKRERFVKDRIAVPKAAAARLNAEAAWDEVADGLAEAAEAATDAPSLPLAPHLAPVASDPHGDGVGNETPAGAGAAASHEATEQEDRRDVVRPTRRRRKNPEPIVDPSAEDDIAEAIARRLEASRTTPHSGIEDPTVEDATVSTGLEGGGDDAS